MNRIVSLWIGMLLLAGAAFAQDPNPLPGRDSVAVQFGQDYTLEAGDTVRGLVLFGGSATIHGEVQRDAVIIGGGWSFPEPEAWAATSSFWAAGPPLPSVPRSMATWLSLAGYSSARLILRPEATWSSPPRCSTAT